MWSRACQQTQPWVMYDPTSVENFKGTLKGGFVGPEVQSEQKYKRCCLPRDQAAVTERAAALGGEAQSSVTYVAIDAEDHGLDDASNSVI